MGKTSVGSATGKNRSNANGPNASTAAVAVGFVAMASLAVPAIAEQKTWLPGQFQSHWSDATAWSPDGIPQGLDDVSVPGDRLLLVDQHTGTLGNIAITEGSEVWTEGFVLLADLHNFGITTIANEGSALYVKPHSVAATFPAFGTATLFIDDGTLRMAGGLALVNRRIENGGIIRGNGEILLGGDLTDRILNSGRIEAQDGLLKINSTAGAKVDLDGGGLGTVHAIDGKGHLMVIPPLSDPYNTGMQIGAGNTIEFAEQLSLTQGAHVEFLTENGTGTLIASAVFHNAELDVYAGKGEIVAANIQLQELSDVKVEPLGELALSGAATNQGQIHLVEATLSGGTLHNTSGANIFGSGAIAMDNLNNNGQIFATGGTLEIDCTAPFPLFHGSDESGLIGAEFGVLKLHTQPDSVVDFRGHLFADDFGIVELVDFGFVVSNGGRVEIDQGTLKAKTMSQNFDSGPWTVHGPVPSRMELDSRLILSAEVELNGPLVIDSPKIHVNASTDFSGPGPLTISQGNRLSNALDAVFRVPVINNGIIRPGASSFESISEVYFGNLTLTETSVVEINILGEHQGGNDVIYAGGELSAGGELRVNYLEDFVLDPGFYAEVIFAELFTGRFDSVGGELLKLTDEAVLLYRVEPRGEGSGVVVLFGARPGDADLNGHIDLRDFATMQNGAGTDADWYSGDVDGDGEVTPLDVKALVGAITGPPSDDL